MPRCFSFPLLDKKEICKHLSDLGAPKLSVENLISPSSDALLPVYDFLVSPLFTYESREESVQPGFEATQMLGDYPELHSESYAVLHSFSRLRKFMTAAGAEDFSIPNDLFRPESQRTVRFLSAAINYIMHSTYKATFIGQLNAMRDEELAKLEEINEEKFKIECDIAQIEQARMAEHPQVEALELETKELNNKIQALNKQRHGMQLDINNLKHEDASILDKISNMDFEIMQKKQEGAHIRSQVVENPQELQRRLQEKKSALVEEEELGRNAAESCETWKAKAEVITKAEKKILKLQRTLQSLEEQINDRNTDKLLKERKARLKAIEKEEWSLDAKKEELNWGVRRLEEHSEKHLQQCNAASKELQSTKARREQCRIEHDARHRVVIEQDHKTEALQRMDADILAHKESKISQMQSSASKLMGVAMKYTNMVLLRQGLDMKDAGA